MTGDIVEKDKMAYGHLSDLEMAFKVRMLYRDTLEHEGVCLGARDRIMYLSQKVERLQKENEEMDQNQACDECDPKNYGWVFNRVEGHGACTCMLEAEPFQILQKALEMIASGTEDTAPPYRSAPPEVLKRIAREALKAVLPLDYAESV